MNIKKVSDNAEKALDEMDGIILCTITDKILVLKEELKKKISFIDHEKFKILHTDLLPNSQEAGLKCTMEKCSLHSQKILGLVIQVPHFISSTMTQACMTSDINKSVQGSSGSMPATKRANNVWKWNK